MYRLVARHLQPAGQNRRPIHPALLRPQRLLVGRRHPRSRRPLPPPHITFTSSFGEWGFVLAGFDKQFPVPQKFDVPTRYLNAQTVANAEMFLFPPDMARARAELSEQPNPRQLFPEKRLAQPVELPSQNKGRLNTFRRPFDYRLSTLTLIFSRVCQPKVGL